MKKIVLTAVCALSALCLSAQDAKNIYNKYSEASDVHSVYISPAMFKLIGKLPDINVNDSDVNFGHTVKSMRGMYVIDSKNPDVNSRLRRDVEKMVESGKYELLMESKENGEKVDIYVISKGETVSSFVLLATESAECTFINLDGEIPLKELQEILAD